MGLIKSFVNAFLIFWVAFIYVMVAFDLRAILLKELPPFVSYQFTANLLLDSLPKILLEGINTDYLIGLSALIIASILIGMVSDSFFDSFMGALIFSIFIIVLSIPFYQLIYLYSKGSFGEYGIGERLSKGFLNMIITIVFSLVGKTIIREEKVDLMKEIELG